MRYLFIFLLLFLARANSGMTQIIFWQENFGNDCGQGTLAHNYFSPNGVWTVNNTGTNGPDANFWYISATENGLPPGTCGTGCSSANIKTLHISNKYLNLIGVIPADGGAVYYAGGLSNCTTDKRAESPNIDCTGKTDITLIFNYIEYGQGSSDNATLWIHDGFSWSLLTDMPKTGCCGGPCTGSNRGVWQEFSIQMPASINNNPYLRIAFRWTNNNDGMGTDPSFAVSNIRLMVPENFPPLADFQADSTEICAGHCIDFTDLSSNNPTSWSWHFDGGQPEQSSAQNPQNVCYHSPGMFSVSLNVSNIWGNHIELKSSYITVNPNPQIPQSQTVFLSEGESTTLDAGVHNSYIWSNNSENQFITITEPGTYSVTVTNQFGCSAEGEFLVLPQYDLIFPNVITPNGDGINDFFQITNIEYYPENNLQIFNRWGTLIYETEGYNNQWKAPDIPDGVYFYTFTWKENAYNGSLTIIHSQ
jgi:gliding motility-associated-like protein